MLNLLSAQSVSAKPPRPGGEGSSGSEYTQTRDDHTTFENFYWQFLALNESEHEAAGHFLEDMLIDCSWKGVTCGLEYVY